MEKPPKFDENDYVEFDLKVDRTPGETVRILRELCDWSQKDLEEKSGVPQTTISAIENNRQNLGVERTNKGICQSVQGASFGHTFPKLEK